MAYPHQRISKPSRFPEGITTAIPKTTLANFSDVSPPKMHVWFDDFDNPIDMIIATPITWTVTTTNSGAVTAGTFTNGANGRLLLTTGATSTNPLEIQSISNGFSFQPNCRTFIKFNCQLSIASAGMALVGLQVINTTPLAANRAGVYWYKADGAATGAVVVANATSTTTSATVNTVTAATDFSIGMVYDPFMSDDAGGQGCIQVYLNDVNVGFRVPVTNLPAATVGLAPVMYVQTKTASTATVLNMDYMLVGSDVNFAGTSTQNLGR
jgi:hypothetical protein